MFVLFVLLFVLFNALIIGSCIVCLHASKNSDTGKNYKVITYILIAIAVVMVIVGFTNLIIKATTSNDTYIIMAESVLVIFNTVLIVFFLKSTFKLIKNLKEDKIFIEENADYLDDISHIFIYYCLGSTISGLVIYIIKALLENSFTINFLFSYDYLLILFIGVAFHIISLLFRKSIEIYEENKLTI